MRAVAERTQVFLGQVQAAVFDQHAAIRHRQSIQRLLIRQMPHAMSVIQQLGIQFTQGQAVTDEYNLQALHCSVPCAGR